MKIMLVCTELTAPTAAHRHARHTDTETPPTNQPTNTEYTLSGTRVSLSPREIYTLSVYHNGLRRERERLMSVRVRLVGTSGATAVPSAGC
jgi:hypothetical protein